MSVDEVASVYGFAQTMANTLIEGLKENCEEMKYLSQRICILSLRCFSECLPVEF